MFISDRFVFVQLHKTGGTHIVKLLARNVGGLRWGKHNAPSKSLLKSGRAFLGSIRDPWDWYVSLWAYGCDRRGAVYIRTRDQGLLRFLDLGWLDDPKRARQRLREQKPRHPDDWRRVYADVRDASRFRDWLHMMHDDAYWEEYGEGYAYSPVQSCAGLLTYRYLNLFCGLTTADEPESLTSYPAIREFERQRCFIDHFVRNEQLESDLLAALDAVGVDVGGEKRARIFASQRTNTSSRKEAANHFYDPDTAALVGRRERLIIDRFGYEPPVQP